MPRYLTVDKFRVPEEPQGQRADVMGLLDSTPMPLRSDGNYAWCGTSGAFSPLPLRLRWEGAAVWALTPDGSRIASSAPISTGLTR